MTMYATGDRIDITIPGAEVIDHGPTKLTFGVPGVDGTYVLPTRDIRAREVLELTRTVPRPQAGELYLVAGRADHRLVAVYNPHDDDVLLVDTSTGEWHWPAEAVKKLGPLHLSVPMPEPTLAVRATAAMPPLHGTVAAAALSDPVS